MLSCSWRETWRRYSEVPARFMGLAHGLKPGSPADFCLIETTPSNQLKSLKTYASGELTRPTPAV
jgi:dihydroorotase-like cyclic amidohydrolase